MRLITSLLFIGLLACTTAKAAESQFSFTYTTDLLPQGAKEVEQWLTWRTKKQSGTFDMIEGKTAFEYGLTDDFQLALYASYAWTQAYHNGPNGATTPPEQFSMDTPGADEHYTSTRLLGVSAEAIYRLLSPYKDGIGVALYVEPTIGEKFLELENRLILQKNFFDDTLTLAFNFTYAPEFRLVPSETPNTPDEWNMETDVNYSLAMSYRFTSNWWVGAEFVNEQERNSLNFIDMANDAYYLGPNIHYGAKSYFVTFTALAQMPWSKEHVSTTPGVVVDGYNLDVDNERYRLRAKIGFYF